jgi:Rieske Fe-S protein
MIQPVRKRVLLVVASVAVISIAVIGAVAALRDGDSPDSRPGVFTVDVSGLRSGQVLTIKPFLPRKVTPIFVVHLRGDGIAAYLGRSTHLGCRLMWVGDPKYHRFTNSPDVAFEDPCGGSVFALDGIWVGGPAPRALDHYPVRVVDDIAEIRVNRLIMGQTRVSPSAPG